MFTRIIAILLCLVVSGTPSLYGNHGTISNTAQHGSAEEDPTQAESPTTDAPESPFKHPYLCCMFVFACFGVALKLAQDELRSKYRQE